MSTRTDQFLARTMTVEQLINELRFHPSDTPVVFACDYGDHCHTQQALRPKDVDLVDASLVVSSGYSQSGFAVDDEPEDDEPEDDEPEDDEPEDDEPDRKPAASSRGVLVIRC